MRSCAKCGKENSGAKNEFCIYCGTKFDAAGSHRPESISPPKSKPAMLPPNAQICPGCGASMDGNNVFCTRCGNKLDSGLNQAADVRAEAQGDLSRRPKPATAVAAWQKEEQGPQVLAAPKKKQKGMWALVLMAALLLLAVGGAVAYGAMAGPDKLPILGTFFSPKDAAAETAFQSEEEEAEEKVSAKSRALESERDGRTDENVPEGPRNAAATTAAAAANDAAAATTNDAAAVAANDDAAATTNDTAAANDAAAATTNAAATATTAATSQLQQRPPAGVVDGDNQTAWAALEENGLGPAEKLWEDIAFTVSASSILEDATVQNTDLTYGPMNLFDGNPATAWVEGAAGNGEGEWLELSASDGQPAVLSLLSIMAGYPKSGDIYAKNSRPRDILVEFSDGSFVEFRLADTYGAWQRIPLERPVLTSSIRITILSVYNGAKYTDTCIAELAVS